MKKYICPRHGDIEYDFIQSTMNGSEGKYCQVCFMELVIKHCCKLEEIEIEEVKLENQ